MRKPTFVLLHGAWHNPTCYTAVQCHLFAHGYTATCPLFPSVGYNHPPSNKNALEADIETVRSTVEDLVDDGKDVIVVMHSYSGIPGGAALEGLDKKSCEERGIRGGVVRLVYLMAWMVAEGYMHTAEGGKRDDSDGAVEVDEKTNTISIPPAAAKSLFYQDLSSADAAYWISQLRPQNLAVFRSTTAHAAWKHIPTTYVFCRKDTAEMKATAEQLIAKVEETEGNKLDKVVRLDVGHSPMLSQPEWVVGLLREAAGEGVDGSNG